MSEDPNEFEVTLLLCDAAQAIGGKLYILGGGWSHFRLPALPPDAPEGARAPVPMALALRISVPWGEANRRIPFSVELKTSDGEAVTFPFAPGPIAIGGAFEVGRPPGVDPGTALDSVLAVNAGALPLEPGRYVWLVNVDGQIRARAPFRIIGPT